MKENNSAFVAANFRFGAVADASLRYAIGRWVCHDVFFARGIGMEVKDALGLILIGAGTTVGVVGYRLLDLLWYFGACIPLAIGALLIWSAARDRKIREALNQGPGDWGNRDYISGSRATDDFDIGAGDD